MESNLTLKNIYEELNIHLQKTSNITKRKEMIISFVQGYIGYFNESEEVDLKKYIPIKNKEWRSRFYSFLYRPDDFG